MGMSRKDRTPFEHAEPILCVTDMARAVKYYVEVLGFENADWGGDDFTCVTRDGAAIYLCEGDEQGQTGSWAWIGVENVENVIPPGTTQARLLLNLRVNDYSSYHASLQRVAGAEIFSYRGVKPGRAKTGASFVFTVPARKLASGDYVLTLRGVNPDSEVDELSKSLFRVDKR